MPFFEMKKKIESDTTVVGRFKILIGDVRERLRDLPDGSVHCCVTSPPYWGLRDYGTGTWEGGDPECDHDRPNDCGPNAQVGNTKMNVQRFYRDVCGKCGAKRTDKQIGLEPTPEDYVATMVEVFREVRRVLREDGTCWLNLGDSYFGDSLPRKSSGDVFSDEWNPDDSAGAGGLRRSAARNGVIKARDLVGIPWMVAFALRADGWYLRQDIIWSKPNPMPESITNRCTKSHEYIFLLTKSSKYFYDNEAVKLKSKATWNPKKGFGTVRRKSKFMDERQLDLQRTQFAHNSHHDDEEKTGANRRSVWTVNPCPYEGAHFASFPPDLIIPCIKAGTSQHGVCPVCKAPWERVVEKTKYEPTIGERFVDESRGDKTRKISGKEYNESVRVIGESWRPTCTCPAADPVPATVLDPFLGSGTTLQVSRWLGRNGIGIELSGDYAGLARERIMKPPQ